MAFNPNSTIYLCNVPFDNSYKNPFKLISISDRENIVFFFDYPKWLKKAFEGRKTSKSIIRAPKDMVQKVHDEKLAFAKKVFENNIKKVI